MIYFMFSSGLCIVVFYAYRFSQCRELIYLVLLILGAKDISFSKIMKAYTIVAGVLLGATIIAASSGILENISFGEESKLAFGIVSSTDFAAHVFFFILCWWYVWGKKMRMGAILPILGAAIFTYYYSQARCSTACLVLLAMMIVGDKGIAFYTRKSKAKDKVFSILACISACSVQLAAVGTLSLTMLYEFDVNWIQKINQLLSNRLELGKRGMSIYGFCMWGQNVEQRGNWVTGAAIGKYFYLDSSYLQMTVIYGIVISVLLMIAFLTIGYRAYDSKKWTLLWVLVLLAIHGVIEQRLWNIAYCPFLLAVFARLDGALEDNI